MGTQVALGFRVHSGWAALVALTGPPGSPSVQQRHRVSLCDAVKSGPFQPYHLAAELSLTEAEECLNGWLEEASHVAQRSLNDVLVSLRERDCRVDRCGILFGSGREPGALAQVLASHAMIHTAEGEFFRTALRTACEHHGLSIVRVRERELWTRAEECTKLPTQRLQQQLANWGKALGPPWRQDQKYACLSAWIALSQIPGATS